MPEALAKLVPRAEDTLRVMLRECAKNDLWLFLTDVLFHPDIDCDEGNCCDKKRTFYEPLHREWCRWAQDDSVDRRLLLAPRGHFKSTVISYAKSVHLIIRDPNVRILLISALEDNAKNFCKQVKNAFRYNARMKWLFPEFHVPPGEQFGPEHSFTTPARTDFALAAPTFTSAYLDASLASQHYDFIILDDPIEAKHVATEEQATKSKQSFNKILPLLDPATPGHQTAMLIVGTRWAYYDLYSGVVPEELGGIAKTTRFACIVRSCLESADGKPDFDHGDPIFASRFPRSVLMGLLEEARADDTKGEMFWWNQYMNLCRAPDSAPFFEDWFVEVAVEHLPPLFGKMIVVDTALKDDTINKKGARGDYTVFIVGGWDREGRLYVIDGVRSNSMTSKVFCDYLVTFAQKYNIVTVVKQRVSEDTLGTQIRDAFAAVNLPLDYRPLIVQGMGRKVQRIKDALQAPMQRHELFWLKRLRENNTWEHHRLIDQARKELLNLGQYPVDDVADCLANFYHPDVKMRKQNLVGTANVWHVPGAPALQMSNERYQLRSAFEARFTPKNMRARRGAGWMDD